MSEVILTNPTQAALTIQGSPPPILAIPPHRAQKKKKTAWHWRMVRLGEMSPAERQIAEQSDAGKSPYAHLCDLVCDWSVKIPCIGNDTERLQNFKKCTKNHIPAAISGLPYKEDRQHVKRDYLLSKLNEEHPSVEFLPKNKTVTHLFSRDVKTVLVEKCGIKDTDFDPFKVKNFHACGDYITLGSEIEYVDDDKRLTARRCSHSKCPYCNDKEAQYDNNSFFDVVEAIAKKGVIDRVRRFVISLEPEYAQLLLSNSEYRKQFLKSAQKEFRRFFGLRVADGLFMRYMIHPVGDHDYMKARFHMHVMVLPVATVKMDGEKKIISCDLPEEKINTDELKALAYRIIKPVFKRARKKQMNIFHSFIPVAEYTNENGAKRTPRWGALRHACNYDFRGFGRKDMLRALVRYSPETGLAVLKKGERDYKVVSILDIADQFLWIKAQKQKHSWGGLFKIKESMELLNYEQIVIDEPEVRAETTILIRHELGNVWDAEKKKVVWVDRRTAYYFEMTEKGRVEIPVNPDIQWSRKGGKVWNQRE